ncbi:MULTISPECIES: hypothetical protein [unclassified Crossiella]|uniref:hypothetical protein n=1 Tax=unclassified Crossiella TaxID=2620835 RepID=UPI00200024E2|nr:MULTISPECIES: hypothetical protein [unclassified Crossiella]MCK2245206.1 hypothetical protein [Crossiella sp. S99.2]MCK2258872.1 hypothetical protein [Crossiella sp. S99.1]
MTNFDGAVARNAGGGPKLELHFSSGWPALTEALKQPGSPLKGFFADLFPNTKTVFQRYKDSVGALVVPASTEALGGGMGTVGGAFDWLVDFLLCPHPDLHLPAVGAGRCGHRMPRALAELAGILATRAPSEDTRGGQDRVSEFDGPHAGTAVDPELLARGCWALALLTELGRGVAIERSPLAAVDPTTVTGHHLLDMASSVALDQLAALRRQAEAVLLPALAGYVGRWAISPTFDGSVLLNADADLIAAGTLVEIKTLLGSKRKDGSRYATLDSQTLFQMIGYVLLDFQDAFKIREIMLFNARYGHVATWPVHDLLSGLAGHPVDLAATRTEFRTFLLSGAKPRAWVRSTPAKPD